MRIAVTFSSKEGLLKEYRRQSELKKQPTEVPIDFFAEGDSFETINAVIGALQENGHSVEGIESDDQVQENLQKLNPDLVFNIAEGLFGDFRESYIPMICERLGLPYSGSDPLTLAVCLNKARTKEILGYYAIPTAGFRVFYPNVNIDLQDVEFPAIIKPIAEGSSKGIFDNSVVKNSAEARARIQENFSKYHQPIILERFLTGDEFTVALWGNGTELQILPIVAISFKDLPAGAQPIYSYEAKWIWDTTEKPLEIFQCPAHLPESIQQRIQALVKRTCQVLGIRDWCRIDIRLDEQGNPNVLELNPLPGILPRPEDNSCFPKAARTAGYSYEAMINKVATIAAKRCGLI